MESIEKLKQMMEKRITQLEIEASKLSRRASAEHDYRTRQHLRELSREARSKAKLLKSRLGKISEFDLSETINVGEI